MTDYNSKNIDVFLNGVNVNEGLAKETFLSITYDNDLITRHLDTKGTNGEVSNSNDLSATIKITCLQNSFANTFLLNMFVETVRGNDGGFHFKCVDGKYGLVFESQKTYTQKSADFEYANEEQNREWSLITTRLELDTTPGSPSVENILGKLGESMATQLFPETFNEMRDLILGD